MSSDGEIIAMRASGVPSRRVMRPVAAFGLFSTAITAFCSLWLTPWSNSEIASVINRMGTAQLTAEVQPRVFEESFPNMVLYVGDVIPGQPARWRPVFIADLTPPNKEKDGSRDRGEGPRVTVAEQALVVPDASKNRLQMSLLNGNTYETGSDPSTYHHIHFPSGEQVLEARERGEYKSKLFTAVPTPELIPEARKSVEARLELHQRFALPLACLLLALTGVPLGVSSRKSGKSSAFVVTVAFAFLYYMALVSLIGLARENKISAQIAAWAPNAIFALTAIILLLRLELPGDRDLVGNLRNWALAHFERFRVYYENRRRKAEPDLHSSTAAMGIIGAKTSRYAFLPQIVDSFILSSWLFYFGVMLTSFVLLTQLFNFFELLGDAFKNQIPISELLRYLFFLAPKLIYDAAPVSVLVATLVTFGILTRNNELTAFKACGVSVYRLAVPVLFVCLALSGALFIFDHYVVTRANIIQDALRNKIKDRPVQTYLSPDRKWILGRGPRVFYYKFFDQDLGILGGVNVYEVDAPTYRVLKHVQAEQARWEPRLNAWIFQNGWSRDIRPTQDSFRQFTNDTATFPEINEPPSWFSKEVKTYKQMTFPQLGAYIDELAVSGFNTIPLQVQYHKKFAVPLFAFVMALLSVPFAFLTGGRGAMTGVGVSLAIAIAYFALNSLFEQLGGVGQLPPRMAAWAPDALFSLAGVYLMTRMKT
jgi:LPS export ABC transporter permease LptG